MKILVTGGCGYKGSVLVPALLDKGHDVTVVDVMWFGNYLPKHPRLTVEQKSVLRAREIDFSGIDAVIHLSSVANDPCGDLNPKLTWETSALATMEVADFAAKAGVKQFIYASSGSVYGVCEDERVIETSALNPISEYNKTKMVGERVLLSYENDMVVQIVRPATVCGLSPRMRLDVSVNMLTMQALKNKEITVFGGNQTRPNIHIDDIASVYLFLLENPTVTGIYNAGFENLSIMEIAEMVCAKVDAKITVTASNDPRSYRVCSDKLLDAGFKPKKSVQIAIDEIVAAYHDGTLTDEKRHYNLQWMQSEVRIDD